MGSIKESIAQGAGWPNDAVYKTEHVCKVWPRGWEESTTVNYWNSREDLIKFLLCQAEWAMSEDNGIRIKMTEWDLGPQERGEITFEDIQFTHVGFGFKPTVENCLQELTWLK